MKSDLWRCRFVTRIFLLLIFLAAPALCPGEEKKDDLSLGVSDYTFLVQMARTSAAGMVQDKDIGFPPVILPEQEAKGGPMKTVYVCLFADGALVGSARADRDTVTEAVKTAAMRIGAGLRTVEHGPAMLERGRIKIDVVMETDLLQRSMITRYMEVLDPGVEGISIKTERGSMHLLPTTLLFAGESAETQIEEVLGLADRGATTMLPDVRKLKTVSFIESEPGGEAAPLFRGNVLLDKIEPDDIEQAAFRAGLWLLSVQEKTGRFKYRSNPVLVIQDPTYNIVRHAGACWSLLWLYRNTGDENFLGALKKGLEYLQEHTERSVDPLKFAHVSFAEKSPLGATALTLLLLSEATLCGAIQADKETMEDYANFIAFMQQDTGEFHKYLRDAVKGLPDKEEPTYYPGQCMLALLQYQKLNPDKKWLEIVEKSAELQIARFQKEDFSDQWVMMALEELYRLTKNPRYSAACFSMADSIVKKQHKPGDVPDPDYAGGFSGANPPETCSAATRIEGLVAAWNLADKVGAPKDAYAAAVRLGAKFIMQQQFRPVNSYMCSPMVPYAGAFHQSPTDFELRIDYAQHAICALIGASQVARSK